MDELNIVPLTTTDNELATNPFNIDSRPNYIFNVIEMSADLQNSENDHLSVAKPMVSRRYATWIMAAALLIGLVAGWMLRRPSIRKTGVGSAMIGLAIEGMKLHKLDNSRSANSVVGMNARCFGFPVAKTHWVANPYVGTYIWKHFTEGLSNEEVALPDHLNFAPDWAIEYDNMDHISTILISSKQSLAVVFFRAGGTGTFFLTSSVPVTTFEAVLADTPEKIPGWVPPAVEPGETPPWIWRSGGGTPSWREMHALPATFE
ncbi:MAG: hypothetical protein R3F19_00050 [Verrucomicrobiales bacterium]